MSPPSAEFGPRQLSLAAKVRLAFEIVGTYATARRTIARHDLKTALARIRDGAPPDTNEPPDRRTWVETARLASVVQRVLRPLPVDSRCLSQSLVLTGLLARRGIGSRLVIGVKRGEKFGAHAWVELGGRAMLPTGGGEFSRLVDL